MRPVTSFVVVCFVYLSAFNLGQSAEVRKEAEKVGRALFIGNSAFIVDHTHPRVVTGMGGRAAFIATLKRAGEDMRQKGLSFARVVVGEPEKPIRINNWLVCFVPETITMKAPGGHLVGESHLLGISEDEGKTWVFIDVGPITQPQFDQVFPELAQAVTLPKKKPGVFKKEGEL